MRFEDFEKCLQKPEYMYARKMCTECGHKTGGNFYDQFEKCDICEGLMKNHEPESEPEKSGVWEIIIDVFFFKKPTSHIVKRAYQMRRVYVLMLMATILIVSSYFWW